MAVDAQRVQYVGHHADAQLDAAVWTRNHERGTPLRGGGIGIVTEEQIVAPLLEDYKPRHSCGRLPLGSSQRPHGNGCAPRPLDRIVSAGLTAKSDRRIALGATWTTCTLCSPTVIVPVRSRDPGSLLPSKGRGRIRCLKTAGYRSESTAGSGSCRAADQRSKLPAAS